MAREYRKKTFVTNKTIENLIKKNNIGPQVIREKIDYDKYYNVKHFADVHRDKVELFVLMTDVCYVEIELHIKCKI